MNKRDLVEKAENDLTQLAMRLDEAIQCSQEGVVADLKAERSALCQELDALYCSLEWGLNK